MGNVPKFNHSPFVFSIWVDFNGRRFKDKYAIELHDGTVHNLAHPNGGGWHIDGTNLIIEDTDVKRIMLLPDGLTGRFQLGGRFRLARNLEYCGIKYPSFIDGKFIWEDEVPEGKTISRDVYIGYKTKPYWDGKQDVPSTIKLIGISGSIVDIGDSKDDSFKEIEEVVNDLGEMFWSDEDILIMTPPEVASAIERCTKLGQMNTDDVSRAIDTCEELGVRRDVYIPMLPGLVEGLKSPTAPDLLTNLKLIASYKKPAGSEVYGNKNQMPNLMDFIREYNDLTNSRDLTDVTERVSKP